MPVDANILTVPGQGGAPSLAPPAEVVPALSTAEEAPLYAASRKIYPQSVKGRFRTLKWVVLYATLGIYYGLPFVRWDRGLNAPSHAVLVDLQHSRFYFFFI